MICGGLKIIVRRPDLVGDAQRVNIAIYQALTNRRPIGELVVHDVNGSPIEIAISESKGAA
jgi:hypothetical protein